MVITRFPLPQNQGKLPLPLFGGNHLGNFAWFYQTKLPLKTVKLLLFFLIMVNYPIVHYITTFYIFRCTSNIFLLSQSTRTMFQKRVTFCIFWNEISHRNDCFWFLELFSILYQAHSVCYSVQNLLICMYLFQNILLHNNVFIVLVLNFVW